MSLASWAPPSMSLDSTPVAASAAQNNSKSFLKNNFSKDNHPRNAHGCALGVHTASNQHNEKNFDYYCGYKNRCFWTVSPAWSSGELTTPANVTDSAVTACILAEANQIIPVSECAFIADKAYDVEVIYNLVRDVYPRRRRNSLNSREHQEPQDAFFRPSHL